jgi:hypothetical protein
VAPQKINLRRPDIMQAVQAQVLTHYRSELVERIRAGGGVLSAGELTVKLAKEFGFCYGVERAIDLAYAAKKHFSEVSPHTPIYLLGEIIHNPEVNDQIRNMGIQIISPKPTDETRPSILEGKRHQHHPRQGQARGDQGHNLASTCLRQRTLSGRVHPRGNGLRVRLHFKRW